MVRKFLNSDIAIDEPKQLKTDFELTDNIFLIQSEKLNDDYIMYEWCDKKDVCDLIPFSTTGANNGTIKQNTYSDEKIKEYSEIVLNNDPFYKYSGATLGAIIEAKDVNWINKALKEMRNEYIKTRIEYLAKAYNLI